MRFKIGHLAAAAAIAGFVGIGGISVAAAQEDTATTTTVQDDSTTTAPDAPAPPERDCPMRDGSSGSSDSGGSSSSDGSSSTDADSL